MAQYNKIPGLINNLQINGEYSWEGIFFPVLTSRGNQSNPQKPLVKKLKRGFSAFFNPQKIV